MKKLLTLLTLCAVLTSCSSAGTKPDTNTPSLPDTPPTESNITEDTPDPTEKKEDIVLTWATGFTISPEDQKVIDKFNEADNGYIITTKSYSKELFDSGNDNEFMEFTDEMNNTLDFHLIQDIINTDDIDILNSSSFGNEAKMKILENKGAFVDLYPFMENDPEINKSTLNEHILTLSEKDGKLFNLPIRYIATTLMGETKYVGEKENWTFDEFVSHWNDMPDNSTINGYRNSRYVYHTVLRENVENFVDYDNAEVHFDSPEFRKMLEFCNQFEYIAEKGEHYIQNPEFVRSRVLSGFRVADTYFDDDHTYTMVGFPSENGNGAFFQTSDFVISAKSSPEKQKGAWEFIKLFASEEYQSNTYVQVYDYGTKTDYGEELCYPINNNVFNQKMQDVMNGMYQPEMYDHQTKEQIIITPTQTECDRLVEYLNSINRIETVLDRSLWRILEDETTAYFAGEKTLDECVDLIQNRASIWISEQS